jgi:DNA repair exonuclease SbcCD ATPase subunit
LIIFKTIRWKNILSTGNVFTEIKLDRSPSTLIVGQNGAGKSTILDAISFALYGKPFRKINKPQLINSINDKDAVAEIEFAVGRDNFKVVRGIKPNVFEIYKNGNLLNQAAANRDYQEMLEKNILKLNHRSFSQVVVLGSSTYVPFMQLPSSHRREVIEDLLDIQIFTTMNTLLKDKINNNKTATQDAKYKIELAKNKIDLYERHISNVKSDKKTRIDTAKAKMKLVAKKVVELNKQRTEIEANISTLRSSQEDLVALVSEMDENNTKLLSLTNDVYSLEKDISFFHDHEHCPTCKQGIEHDFKQSSIVEKTAALETTKQQRTSIQEKCKETTDRKLAYDEIENQIRGLERQLQTVELTLASEKKIFFNLNKDVEEINTETENDTDVTNEVTQTREELSELESSREKLANEAVVLNAATTLLKDGGIKSRIIKQYIPIMNKLINKYLAAMDFFVHFELDEQFNEKIKSRFRDEFSYNSFSEGEKMRINLAVLFTWRAIAKMRNSASTNLLIMDEVFDSSLDGVGTDEFFKILNELTADTNTFVISHKGDALYDKFRSVIRFEKHGNFSRML